MIRVPACGSSGPSSSLTRCIINICASTITYLVYTDAVLLVGFLKPVSHISDIFEFCRATFSRLLFFQARRLLGSPSIKLASHWSKELFCRRLNYQRQEITTVLETRAKEVNYWRQELLDYWRQELRRRNIAYWRQELTIKDKS